MVTRLLFQRLNVIPQCFAQGSVDKAVQTILNHLIFRAITQMVSF